MSDYKCMDCIHGAVCDDFGGSHAKDCEFFKPENEWISIKERPPEVETEVLVVAGNKGGYKTITTAIYEDGTVSTDDSIWNWYDLEFDYDEENDKYLIPEGWWEYKHYNPDDVYNMVIDEPVTHWQPLPDPPTEQ